MVNWQRARIALCLSFCRDHRGGPSTRAPPRRAAFHPPSGGLAEQIEVFIARFGRSTVSIRTLLRFEDKRSPTIAVDPTKVRGAIAIISEYATLEYIIVLGVLRLAAVRRWDAYKIAKTVDEALRIRQLRPTGFTPGRNEFFNFVGGLPHRFYLPMD